MKIYTSPLFLLLAFAQNGTHAQVLTRGPYLQMGNQTAISLRWRTDVPTNSKVSFGTASNNLNQSLVDNNVTKEHEMRLTNLATDTKYFYAIGSTTVTLQGNTDNYFVTMPPLSTKRKIRVVGFGDSGNGSQNQIDVRDAFINFRGTTPTDVMLLMGDNAYSYGYELEYQNYFFNVYQSNLLKNCKLYPVIGNHDYNNTDAANALRGDPVHYYDCFTLPKNAECGGTVSGTEAFYSFDYGGIHFIMLDSYGTENGKKLYDSTGLQAQWLKADLMANTQKWTIAVMHHPPYTKGSHDSDAEQDLVAIREQINPILERFGVDIALFGHSHVFERSFLIKNHYGLETTFSPVLHQVTASSGKYDGSMNACPINLTTQKTKHGTVYVVAGSAGQIGGAANGWTHDAMIYSDNQLGGVFYFEVEDNRLDAFFLKSNGVIGDNFTLMKDVSTKKTLNVLVGQPTTLTASYIGNYTWTGGTTARTLTVSPPLGTYTYYVNDNVNCLKDTFIVQVSTVIPVELQAFKVNKTPQNTVLVEWQTASERQNSHFLVERATDGVHFETLEKRAGHPLSTQRVFYNFLDKSPSNGINYYRLSQVDDDGTTTVFGVQSVVFNQKPTLTVAPNPSKDGRIEFSIRHFEQKIGKIVITDVLGKVVVDMPTNATHLSANLPIGVYMVQLWEGATVVATQKVIVE